MEIRLEQFLSRADGVVFTELDGDTVILDMKSGEYNGLDDVATETWNYLESTHSFADLVEHIVKLYEVDHDTCRADMQLFLAEMVDTGLLVLHSK